MAEFRPVTKANIADIYEVRPRNSQMDDNKTVEDALAHAYVDTSMIPRLIYIDDNPAGFLMYRHEDHNLEILRFFIADEWQGVGHGKSAMVKLLNEARDRGATSASYSAHKSDYDAIAFCKTMGFVKDDNGKFVKCL